jgi:hypothetical protein
MQKNPKRVLSFAVCVGIAAAAGLARGEGDDEDNTPASRAKVTYTYPDGRVNYEPVHLSNATLRLSEFRKSLISYSTLFDFDLNLKSKNQLGSFRMILRPEPQNQVAPPPGAATWRPVTRWTVYDDLNGDSVLDTMIQRGPELHSSFILVKNSWVEVGNLRAGWRLGSVRALKTKQTYVFENGGWRPKAE